MARSTNYMLGLPAEIKFQLLEHLDGRDLYSLEQVDHGCLQLCEKYPRQITRAILHNIHHNLQPEAQHEAYAVFQLREARREYIEHMGARCEDEQNREALEETLKRILFDNEDVYGDDELVMTIESLAAYSDLVSEVNSLINRYANDAWKRIHGIAVETGTGSPSPAGTVFSSPNINLTAKERGRFQRAILTVEIYLLTTFHTDGQDQRHQLNMGEVILDYVPHGDSASTERERRQFDSCLRYMFHAYRAHLRRTARELGVPEYPIGKVWGEEDGVEPPRKKPRISASATSPVTHSSEYDAKNSKFAWRSVHDEQSFLLWLCEFGIGPLEQTHRASVQERRYEMLEQFSRSHVWGASKLKQSIGLVTRPRRATRQRHPVKNLYGFYPTICG